MGGAEGSRRWTAGPESRNNAPPTMSDADKSDDDDREDDVHAQPDEDESKAAFKAAKKSKKPKKTGSDKSGAKKSSAKKSETASEGRPGWHYVVMAAVVAVVAWFALDRNPTTVQPWPQALAAIDDNEGDLDADNAKPLMVAIQKAVASGSTVEVPDALAGDDEYRVVFLSVGGGSTAARTFVGHGPGWKTAVEDATAQAVAAGLGVSSLVRLEVVEDARKVERNAKDMKLRIASEGLGFPTASPIALSSHDVVAFALLKKGKVVKDRLQGRLQDLGFPAPQIADAIGSKELFALKTAGFYYDADNDEFQALIEGHPTIAELTAENLLARTVAGAEYLTNAQDSRGRYIYEHTPGIGNPAQAAWAADPTAEFDSSKVDKGYNMLRHAGTSFSLAQAGGASGDKRYFEAARKGIVFLIGISRKDPLVQGDHIAVVDKGATKVGGNGLALVALAEYTKLSGDTQFIPDAVRYGEWLVQTQHDDGDWPHKRDIRTGEVEFKNGKEWKSGYYPGEAILGLVRLYEINEDPKWLDAAEKATRFLIDVRDKGRPIRQLEPDHWLLYGLEALHKHRPDEVFVTHANKIIDRILGDQTLDEKDKANYGGFGGRPARATPAATRVEGLVAAHKLLTRVQAEQTRRDQVARAIDLGLKFTLQHQLGRPRTMTFANGATYDGAFSESAETFEIRIDFVQHSISAMLGHREMLMQ